MDGADEHLFTCLSCMIAFTSAEDQREHYRSEHHRYNMKRRVAGLPPVTVAVFTQKVLDRKTETAIMSSARGSTCDVCHKTYTTENAYRSHINSKKHRENEIKAALNPQLLPSAATAGDESVDAMATDPPAPASAPAPAEPEPAPADPSATGMTVDADADDDEIAQTIDAKIAAARARLAPSDCLFCAHASSSLEENLLHMSGTHSFFVPDTDYLVDAPGLLAYLGEKVAVGNVCLYCNGRGREFRTLDAVRKHMVDKGHCKLAYDTQRDQLEISDYYDFRASYPDAAPRKSRKLRRPTAVPDAEEWEDIEDDDGSADEVVDASASESGTSDDEDGDADEDDADALPESGITYGDSHYELVLPSGARIGHRSLKRYYAQSFPGAPRGGAPEDPASGAALVRRLLKDKTSALVPRRGGFGAFGAGTDVVKARNRGEAREAGRHMREFRDVNRKEQYKTRVAYQNNYQKHYRDPLLQ